MQRNRRSVADFDPAMLSKELHAYGQPLSIHRP
jgi:hypothetical protein